MPPRRGRYPRALRAAIAIAGVLGLTVGFGVALRTWADARGAEVLPAPAARPMPPAVDLRPAAFIARDVYPYSVVPGGVHGADEALRAADEDPVVREHYEGIALHAAAVKRVGRPRAVHVSYRVGDRVYWTRNTVMLRAGETLLSDGSAEIRARCGNRVSDAAQEPTSPVEPSVEELDSPVATAGREVAPEAGALDPLRAYELFASVGAMPPAMSAEGLPAAIPGVPPAIVAGPVVVGGWLGGIPGAPGGPTGGGPVPAPQSGPTDAPPTVPPGPPTSPPTAPPTEPPSPPPTQPPTPPVTPPVTPPSEPPITPPGEPPVLPPSEPPPTTSVPEPSTLLLVGLGLGGLALRRRRSKKI